jgi:hypothetical protein
MNEDFANYPCRTVRRGDVPEVEKSEDAGMNSYKTPVSIHMTLSINAESTIRRVEVLATEPPLWR